MIRETVGLIHGKLTIHCAVSSFGKASAGYPSPPGGGDFYAKIRTRPG